MKQEIKMSEMVNVRIQKLQHGRLLPIPSYASNGASAFDLMAAIDNPLYMSLWDIKAVQTGFCFEIPNGYELQIRPRSGLAINHGLTVLNTPGTIDSDYRGEVMVILIYLGKNGNTDTYKINPGDRIAQAVLCPVTRAFLFESNDLSETERGSGRFGSTGP